MKIAIDARGAVWFRGTGIGTYAYQLIHNLCEIDTTNEYILFLPDENEFDLPKANNFRIKVIPENEDREVERQCITRELVAEAVDLYHIPQNGFGFPMERRCRLVVTIHDLIPYILPQTCNKGYLKKFLFQIPLLVESADAIITVSHRSKKDLIQILKVPEEKIVVIYEAPEDIYKPIDKDIARGFVQERYGINGPYILYIGGFSLRKNLNHLIHSYKKMQKDLDSPIKLAIFGKMTSQGQQLVELVERMGLSKEVLFPGYVPVQDMPYVYNGSELFVYPSLYEGFGLPVLEAMACGVPVVTTDTSSLPEIAQDAALMIDPYEPDSLRRGMLRVLSDKDYAEQLMKKGLRRAAQYSWRKAAFHTLLVYESFLGD